MHLKLGMSTKEHSLSSGQTQVDMHPLSVCIYISISKIILKNVGPPGLKIFLKMSSVLYDCVLLRKLEDFLLFLSPLEFFENRKLKWVF